MERQDHYTPAEIESVRATCLYLATKFGDLVDMTVIVGGFARRWCMAPN